MSYRDDMLQYTDPTTGLVGITPNPAGYSSGNPLLETSTAYVFMTKLGLKTPGDANTFVRTLDSCSPDFYLYPCVFYSKTPDTRDRISHDDIVGMVAGFSATAGSESIGLKVVLWWGQDHDWIFSSDGAVYWDAVTKPWHYAFYKLAGGVPVGFLAQGTLAAFVAWDGAFNRHSASDKKLVWLMLETIPGKSKIVDLAAKFWRWRLKNTWGSMTQVFRTYYGPNHLFAKYCREDW